MNNKQPKKWKVATVSLSGCFGCHMSFLDIDEKILDLLQVVEFDRSPITDIKTCSECDIGLIEGGVCNSENVEVLREFRKNCRILIAIGTCAISGGLPSLRNNLDVEECLHQVYCEMPRKKGEIPDDVELPLLLDKVHPINEVVRVDYFIPGCPPTANAIWKFLTDFVTGQTPHLDHFAIRYD